MWLIAAYGYSLAGTYSLGKLAAVALGGLWLALGPVYRRPGADRLLLAYLAALAAVAPWSANPWFSLWHMFGTYTAGLIAALVLVPYWACLDARHRPGLVAGLRRGAALLAAVAILQRAGGWLLPYPLFAGERAYSTLGSPVYVGAMCALLLPFCASWPERLLLLAGLWTTGSRAGWLGCALGAAYLAWPAWPRRWRWIVILATAGTARAALARWHGGPSDLGRVFVWHAALQAYAARPWAGWGPGNYVGVAELYRHPGWHEVYGMTTQDHAHNAVLEAAATSGTIGLLGLAALWWALWRATAVDRAARAALLGLAVVALLEPVPPVVKAVALAIAATAVPAETAAPGLSRAIRLFACNIFFAVLFLILLDRLMTFYGDAPWSASSGLAAYLSGVITMTQPASIPPL